MPVAEASLTLFSYIIANVSGIASRRLSSSVSSAIRYMFSELTCFIVENIAYTHPRHTYVLPNFQTSTAENFQYGKCISADYFQEPLNSQV